MFNGINIFVYYFYEGLSEEMFDEGFVNISNIDISGTVIKSMQAKYKDKGPSFKCFLYWFSQFLINFMLIHRFFQKIYLKQNKK